MGKLNERNLKNVSSGTCDWKFSIGPCVGKYIDKNGEEQSEKFDNSIKAKAFQIENKIKDMSIVPILKKVNVNIGRNPRQRIKANCNH